MGKFCGTIGYSTTVEARPGVYVNKIMERPHKGDRLETSWRMQAQTDSTIDDVRLSDRISIVADPYALANYHCMKYVNVDGARWSITNVSCVRPRVTITLGGLYHGPTPEN